jgi:RimJ/RimL family protein N-acetyltransferase
MARLPDRLAAGPVELQRWTLGHLDALVTAIEASLPDLQPWMPWANPVPTREQNRAVLEAAHLAFEADDDYAYFLIEAGTGLLVGAGGLHRRVDPTISPDTLEIGYWVRSDRTGRGYATAAAAALTEAAFTYLPEMQRVEIRMDKANTASAAVPPKLGYRLVGKEERAREAPGHTGSGLIWARDRQPG